MWDTRSIYLGKEKTQKNVTTNSSKSGYLDKIKSGTTVKIYELPSGEIRSQLIRLGIAVGEIFVCLKRLPGGTIVLGKNRQEIALGFELAKKIRVIII